MTTSRSSTDATDPAMFRTFFEEMPCYVTVQNRDFRIIEANRMFRADFGDPDGGYCYAIYKGRDAKCDSCPVERTFLTGQKQGSEEVIRTRNGQRIDIVAYTSPIKNEKGEVESVLEISADITEIVFLQRRLKESENQIRLLFDETPCYVSVQDRDLRLLRTNRRFKEDFGSGLGGYCYEVYKHRSEPCIPCPVIRTFHDGEGHESEEIVTSKSGEKINVLVRTTPLRDASGEIARVMEMSTNITEIRRLQSQLTSLGLLVSSISHGVKGLVTGLDGGMYLIGSGLEKDDRDRIKQGWDMIRRNVGRIRSMVLDILYYAKDREPEWESVSAPEAARRVCRIVEGKAGDLGIEVREKIDEGAGEFVADPKAINTMLLNIVENALDACRKDRGKEEHWVRVVLAGDGEEVVFEVADNGVGIERETREKLFTLFFSSKGFEGTGLGLFIADKIVRKHGGTIDIDSAPNEGSRFTIRLPRKR